MTCRITVTLKQEGGIDYEGITRLMTACGCMDISVVSVESIEDTIIALVEHASVATNCIAKLENEFNRYIVESKYRQE